MGLISLLGWIRGSTKAFVNKKELSYTDHSHDLNNLSGILPVTKGGTGVTSLDALLALLGNSGINIMVTGEYVGNGTYGPDHPSSISFINIPYLVCVYGKTYNSEYGFFFPFALDTSYRNGAALIIMSTIIGDDNRFVAKFSNNTLIWYQTHQSNLQLNSANVKYYYVAFIDIN